MGFRKLKTALIAVGVVSIGITTVGAIYLKRNKVQIIIKTVNWMYESPDIIIEELTDISENIADN